MARARRFATRSTTLLAHREVDLHRRLPTCCLSCSSECLTHPCRTARTHGMRPSIRSTVRSSPSPFPRYPPALCLLALPMLATLLLTSSTRALSTPAAATLALSTLALFSRAPFVLALPTRAPILLAYRQYSRAPHFFHISEFSHNFPQEETSQDIQERYITGRWGDAL